MGLDGGGEELADGFHGFAECCRLPRHGDEEVRRCWVNVVAYGAVEGLQTLHKFGCLIE